MNLHTASRVHARPLRGRQHTQLLVRFLTQPEGIIRNPDRTLWMHERRVSEAVIDTPVGMSRKVEVVKVRVGLELGLGRWIGREAPDERLLQREVPLVGRL